MSPDTLKGRFCPKCKHPWNLHFNSKDEIGEWGFCEVPKCECFYDHRWDEAKETDRWADDGGGNV